MEPVVSRMVPTSSPLMVLLLLLVAGSLVESASHAQIRSKYGGQLVTSSTLRWAPATSYDLSSSSNSDKLSEAVPSGTGDASNLICRSDHHGAAAVLGYTSSSGYCAVAFLGRVHRKQRFEVLINGGGAARLEWRPYSKFGQVPEGAVAVGEDAFVGRRPDGDGGHFAGSIGLDPRSSAFGDITVFSSSSASSSNSVAEETSGQVLVEVEPERYELEITDAERAKPKISRSDVVLAKSSLFRFDEGRDREARLQKVLAYDYEKSEYYGQVPGTIRALPAQVLLPGGQVSHLLWALPERTTQRETLMVGHPLRHQSAVDVSVVAVRVTEERPYAGRLTAVYSDGDSRTRYVEGVLQRRYLDKIRPEYSRVYRIKDSVVVSASDQPRDDSHDYGGRKNPSKMPSSNSIRQSDSTSDYGKPRKDDESSVVVVQAAAAASSAASWMNLRRTFWICAFTLAIVKSTC